MIDFETHDEMFLILPLVGVTEGECTDPDCRKKHYRLSIGWLIWSVHLIFA